MKTLFQSRSAVAWPLFSAISLLFSQGLPSLAAEPADTIRFQVQLVWGTNGLKPKDKELKDLEDELLQKLKGVFKWKNYYEVSKHRVGLEAQASKKLKLSDRCLLHVRYFGHQKIEVTLVGEGKHVLTKRQKVIPGELLVLAGDDKNDTAWFVVVKRLED